MKNNKGFIEIKNVSDYWGKLQFDFQELKNNPENTYSGFNFFVTAYHLVDWVVEGNYNGERKKLNKNSVIKICNHIANGIKHFETNRHKSIQKIEKTGLYEEGFYEKGFFENPITIHLENEFVSEFGESINIIKLAELVMDFWKKELIKRTLI